MRLKSISGLFWAAYVAAQSTSLRQQLSRGTCCVYGLGQRGSVTKYGS